MVCRHSKVLKIAPLNTSSWASLGKPQGLKKRHFRQFFAHMGPKIPQNLPTFIRILGQPCFRVLAHRIPDAIKDSKATLQIATLQFLIIILLFLREQRPYMYIYIYNIYSERLSTITSKSSLNPLRTLDLGAEKNSPGVTTTSFTSRERLHQSHRSIRVINHFFFLEGGPVELL